MATGTQRACPDRIQVATERDRAGHDIVFETPYERGYRAAVAAMCDWWLDVNVHRVHGAMPPRPRDPEDGDLRPVDQTFRRAWNEGLAATGEWFAGHDVLPPLDGM